MNHSLKKFNWLAVWLIGSVTCGIYLLYALGYMSGGNNALAERYGVKKIMSFTVAFLLGFVTFGIVPIVWFFLFQDQQAQLSKAVGAKTAPSDNGIVLGILMFVPIYGYYVLCDNYNRTIEACR